VVKDREELLAKARRDGELLVQRAQDERSRLLSDEEVVMAAQAEADRILEEATPCMVANGVDPAAARALVIKTFAPRP